MSVRYTSGSICECDAEAIINPVNCVASRARDSPSSSPCATGERPPLPTGGAEGRIRPGRGLITKTEDRLPRYIINFPPNATGESAAVSRT